VTTEERDMADAAGSPQGLTTRRSQPLIGIPTTEGAEEVVQYFTSEEDADRALAPDRAGVERALSLIGAWQHLDAEDGPDMLDELDRIRHQSQPSPPLDL
jgi:hypothetical protein